jgi:hypothetical protein
LKAVGRRSLEIPGTAAKVDLERELSQALARSDAAARAADGVRSEVAEAARKLASVESEITLAVAAIALEEMATIADAARGAMATIAEACGYRRSRPRIPIGSRPLIPI